MLYRRPLIRLLVLMSSIAFLAQCGQVSVIHYTIPDNYEGFLVIRYNCPNRDGPSASSPEDTFSILWVGEIAHLAAMSKDGSYSTRLAEFLETNFGIPRRP
jgi:hypothetical protein